MEDIDDYIKTLNIRSYSKDIIFNKECNKIIFNTIPEYKKMYLLVKITNFLSSAKYSFKIDENLNILVS